MRLGWACFMQTLAQTQVSAKPQTEPDGGAVTQPADQPAQAAGCIRNRNVQQWPCAIRGGFIILPPNSAHLLLMYSCFKA